MSDCVRIAHRIIPVILVIAWALSCGSGESTGTSPTESPQAQAPAPTVADQQATQTAETQLPPEEGGASVIGGRVVTTEGNAIAGVEIRFLHHSDILTSQFPQSGDIWNLATAYEATTDADGAFSLPDVAPGRWHLAFQLNDNDMYVLDAPLSVARGWDQDDLLVQVPNTTELTGQVDSFDETPIANANVHFTSRDMIGWMVHRGSTDATGAFTFPAIGRHRDSHLLVWAEGYGPLSQRRWESAALRGRDLPAITLENGANLEGIVLGTDGRPLAGAEVFATSPLNAALTGIAPGQSTTSDANGAFHLTNLPSGPLDLHAHTPVMQEADPIQTLGIPGDTIRDIAVPLRASNQLAGTISDPDGNPVEGAIVAVIEENGGPGPFGAFGGRWAQRLPDLIAGDRWTRTGANGRFAIDGIRSNERVNIAVIADAAPPVRFRSLTTSHEHDLALPEGMTITGEVISMRDNTVINMAQVTTVDDESGAAERVLSTSSGQYQVHHLASGTESVRGLALDHASRVVDDIRTDYQAVRTGIDLLLPIGVTVGGNVRDLLSSVPIADAEISLLNEGDDVAAFTDSDGNYRLDHVGPGRHVLRAEASHYLGSSPLQIAVDNLNLHGLNFVLEPAARIEGRVIETTGAPIPGATVGVRYTGRRWGRDAWDLRQTTTTDAEGRYSLEEVEPNISLSVVAQHPTHAQTSVEDLRIEAGATRAPVDLIMTVGGTLVVKVVDESSQPIMDAEVRQAREEERGRGRGRGFGDRGVLAILLRGEEQAENVAHTDLRGITRFEHLIPGNYTVAALTEDNPYDFETGVEVREAEETPEIVIMLRPGSVIEGRVIDQEGFPIAEAEVMAMRRDRERPMFDQALTSEDGIFRFTGLDTATFSLTAQAEGYDSATADVAAPSSSAELTLELAGAIAGHVFDAETDAAITAFDLTATRQGRGWGGGPGGPRGPGGPGGFGGFGGRGTQESFIDPGGAYEMSGLTAGTWNVVATVPGYAPMTIEGVEVTNGAKTENVDFAIRRGATISGHVMNTAATPQPISGVTVRLETGGGGGGGRFFGPGGPPGANGDSNTIAVTDQEGLFTLTGIEEGDHRLMAEAAGYLEAESSVTVEGTTDPEPVTITLRQGGRVVGRVVNARNREPVAGAQVSLPREGFVEELARDLVRTGVTTGADGRFEMPSVPTGNMPLIVEHSDFPDLMTDMILIEEGEETNVGDIQLAGGGDIAGYTFNADGEFLPNATVMLNGPNVFEATRSDDEGEFSFEHLPQGEYRLTLYERGGPFSPDTGSQITENATVREGRETEVILSLLPGYTVSGTVRDEGTPVEGIEVRLALADGSGTGEGGSDTSDESGEYSIENLGPGDYTVTASQRQGRRAVSMGRNSVTVTSGDTTFDIDLPRSTISGQVVNLQGEPVNRADVAVLRDGEDGNDWRAGREATRTDGNGNYTLERVQEGDITILVRSGNDGYAYTTRDLTVGYGEDLTGINFTLDDAGRLEGEAVLASNHSPISQFYAIVSTAQGTQVFARDVNIGDDGRYSITGLAEGAHTISAYRDNYAPIINREFTVTKGEIAEENLEFEQGGTLTVTVEDGDNSALSGAVLRVYDPDTGREITLRPTPSVSSAEGTIQYQNMPRGRWRCVVSKSGYSPDEFTLTIHVGDNQSEEVRLESTQ